MSDPLTARFLVVFGPMFPNCFPADCIGVYLKEFLVAMRRIVSDFLRHGTIRPGLDWSQFAGTPTNQLGTRSQYR
jgi:hypothetical protein